MVLVYGPAYLMRAVWLSGAVDYLKEPWDPEELFLRLRGPRTPAVVWAVRHQELRLEGAALTVDGRDVELSGAEAELLRLLVKRRGTPVPRRILAWVAGCNESRVVDTLVARIRKKIRHALGTPGRYIVAVRGVGYSFPCTILGLMVSWAP